MATGIIIREADSGDVDALADLNRVGQDLHLGALPQYFKRADPLTVGDWFRTMLARDGVRAWIASSNGHAVGYALAVVHSRPENPFAAARSIYELDQIAVLPGFRRRGVARAMVLRVLADAKDRGFPDVDLTSWSFNAEAHDAFAALGFRPKVVRFGRETG